MPFTRDGIDKALRGVFQATPVYVGLCESSSAENGAAAADKECAGPGYHRQLVLFGEPHDSEDGEVRELSNANIVVFPLAQVESATRGDIPATSTAGLRRALALLCSIPSCPCLARSATRGPLLASIRQWLVSGALTSFPSLSRAMFSWFNSD